MYKIRKRNLTMVLISLTLHIGACSSNTNFQERRELFQSLQLYALATTLPHFVGGTVDGTVSGLTGKLVLMNNGDDELTITSNGEFQFAKPIAGQENYSVTVKTHPTGQGCTIANAGGTINLVDITDLRVTCSSSAILDPSFADNGVFTFAGSDTSEGYAIVPQNDGNILVAGNSDNYSGSDSGMNLWRLNADGGLDASFTNSGKMFNNAMAIQSDGKILAAGSLYENQDSLVTVWRLNSDGSLDTTFSTDGVFTLEISTEYSAYTYAIAVRNDGKIFVTGKVAQDMFVLALNSDGTLDTSFASSGVFMHRGYNAGFYAVGKGIAVQNDDKIIVVGDAIDATEESFDKRMIVWRLNSDGTLDNSFAVDGLFIAAGGVETNTSYGNDIALQTDGKILVAGSDSYPSIGTSASLMLWRLNSDGSLDTSFDSDGIVTFNEAPGAYVLNSANSLAVAEDGSIFASGLSYKILAIRSVFDFAIWRFNADGSLHGFTIHNRGEFDGGSYGSRSPVLTLQNDGKVLMTGSRFVKPYATTMAVWRFIWL